MAFRFSTAISRWLLINCSALIFLEITNQLNFSLQGNLARGSHLSDMNIHQGQIAAAISEWNRQIMMQYAFEHKLLWGVGWMLSKSASKSCDRKRDTSFKHANC